MRIPAIVSAAALLTALAAPADAAISPPTAQLDITVADSTGTPVRGALLSCPDGLGNHPHGEATCTALTTVNGDFNALPRQARVCTKEYDPVTATATGVWNGVPVNWSRTYSNSCVMESETGPAFRFWD